MLLYLHYIKMAMIFSPIFTGIHSRYAHTDTETHKRTLIPLIGHCTLLWFFYITPWKCVAVRSYEHDVVIFHNINDQHVPLLYIKSENPSTGVQVVRAYVRVRICVQYLYYIFHYIYKSSLSLSLSPASLTLYCLLETCICYSNNNNNV